MNILSDLDSNQNWYQILISDGIGIRLPNTKTFEELGKKIQERANIIKSEGTYLEYNKPLLELVNWTSNNPDLAGMFLPDFNNKKTQFFFHMTIGDDAESNQQIFTILKNKENLKILSELSEQGVDLHGLKRITEMSKVLGGLDKIIEEAEDLVREEADFQMKQKKGEMVERVFKNALQVQGINAEVKYKGYGSHDFKVTNTKNGEEFFIELKSHAFNSNYPICLAISQAKLAFKNPDRFALCILQRPELDDNLNEDYLIKELLYQSHFQDLLSEALVDFGTLEKILLKNSDATLKWDFKGRPKISLSRNFINLNPSNFSKLINDIKSNIQ